MVQKKKRKGLEQEAEAITAEQDRQPGTKQKRTQPLPDEEVLMVTVSRKKKVKAKLSASLGGQRTSDMMKLLVS